LVFKVPLVNSTQLNVARARAHTRCSPRRIAPAKNTANLSSPTQRKTEASQLSPETPLSLTHTHKHQHTHQQNTQQHTHTHANTHTNTHRSDPSVHTHTRTHTQTHTHMIRQIYRHTHTHTHTHRPVP